MATPFWSVDDIPSVPTLVEDDAAVYNLENLSFINDKFVFRWSIINYTDWPRELDEVKSPKFRNSRSGEWCLVVCRDVSGALYMCFELLSTENVGTVRATLKASLVSNTGKKYPVYPLEFVVLDTPKKWKWRRLTGAFVPENGLDKALTFIGEVNTPYSTVEPQPSAALLTPRRSVTEDLAALLCCGQLSDVSLWAGGQEFKAHRAVLAARSPVFAAMLRHDTQEARTGRIDVQDMEADVLGEVLRFVYTGGAPLLEMADRLLVAADKYDLPDLKQLCELQLARNLTVENAAATAVVALGRSCDVLRRSVVSFVQRHLVRVMGSEGWMDAVTNHGGIVAELSRLIANEPVEVLGPVYCHNH